MDLFERIENFFRRLERYIDVQQPSGMEDVIVRVMVEVLSILAIATKEINQSSASALIRGDGPPSLAHSSLEALLKKLVGRADIEYALQRLDKLIQDEAWMATAEGLRTTQGIVNKVEDVGAKVKGVVDQIGSIDDKVQGVGDRINVLGNKIIDGAQITFDQSPPPL